jgi:tetratricopeptide (TPR) repeat protein
MSSISNLGSVRQIAEPTFLMQLQSLPPELVGEIFSYLSEGDLRRVMCVNTEMKNRTIVVLKNNEPKSILGFIEGLINSLNAEKHSKQIESLTRIAESIEFDDFKTFSVIKNNILSVKNDLINVIRTLDKKEIESLKESHKKLPNFMGDAFELSRIFMLIDSNNIILEDRNGRALDEYNTNKGLCKIAKKLSKQGYFNESIRLVEKISYTSDRYNLSIYISKILSRVATIEERIQFADKITDTEIRGCFLRDISQALTEMGRFNEAIEFANKITYYYTRNEQFSNIFQSLLENTDQIDKVTELADKIAIADSREAIFERILEVFVRRDEIDKAAQLATDKITQIGPRQDRIFKYCAEVLAHEGRFDKAAEFADKITDTRTKRPVFSYIFKVLVKERKLDEAIKFIDKITGTITEMSGEKSRKDCAFLDISKALARAFRSKEAVENANHITSEYMRKEAFLSIANVWAEEGALEKVVDFIKVKFNEGDRDNVFGEVVRALINERRFDDAIEIASKQIRKGRSREYVFLDISAALIRGGEFDRAINLAETEITITSLQDKVFQGVSLALARIGRFEEAIEMADKINDNVVIELIDRKIKDETFSDILNDFAETKLDKAVSLVDAKISDEHIRDWTFYLIALSLTRRDLKKAIEIANKIVGLGHCLKDSVFACISRDQMDGGNFDEAIKTATNQIVDTVSRDETIEYISRVLVNAGDFDAATKVADEIVDKNSKDRAFAYILKVRLDAGDFDGAIELADKITGTEYDIFCDIVKALTDVSEFSRAFELANKITYEGMKDDAFCDIAKALAYVGDFDEAIRIANKINYKRLRGEIILHISEEEKSRIAERTVFAI